MAEELIQTDFTEQPKRGVRWIFIGNDGIRAGWGALIFIAIFVALTFAVGALVSVLFHPHMQRNAPIPWRLALVQEAVRTVLVLIAAFIMSRREAAFGRLRLCRKREIHSIYWRPCLRFSGNFRACCGAMEVASAGI